MRTEEREALWGRHSKQVDGCTSAGFNCEGLEDSGASEGRFSTGYQAPFYWDKHQTDLHLHGGAGCAGGTGWLADDETSLLVIAVLFYRLADCHCSRRLV